MYTKVFCLFLVLLLQGCGLRFDLLHRIFNNDGKVRNISLPAHGRECVPEDVQDRKLVNRVETLKKKRDQLIRHLAVNRLLDIRSSFFSSTLPHQGKTPYDPLLISPVTMSKNMAYIEHEVDKISDELHGHLFKGESVSNVKTKLSYKESRKLLRLFKDIDLVVERKRRWGTKICDLKYSRSKDYTHIRSFYKIHQKICDSNSCDFDLFTLDFFEQNSRDLINICIGVERNPARCQKNAVLAKLSDKMKAFGESYLESYESEILPRFFELDAPRKYKCSKEDEKVTMHVPFIDPKDDDLKKKIIGMGKYAWARDDKFEIEINFVEKGRSTPRIARTNSHHSYVTELDPYKIHLAQNLERNALKKILEHEFGHVLGFPDCYVEYLERDSKTLVYFELDPTNRMCTLSSRGRLLDDHIDQLTQQACEF